MSKKHYPYMDKDNDCCFSRCLKDKVRSEKLWNMFREFLKLSNYANYDIGDYRE